MEVQECVVGGGYFGAAAGEFSPEKRFPEQKLGENFTIDDLLDFSNDDAIMSDGFLDNIAGNSTDSSTVTAVDSCNSSVSGGGNHLTGNFGSQFSGELCVPYDDLAVLEWLSNFVEDSFSTEHNLQSLPLTTTTAATKPQTCSSSSSSSSSALQMPRASPIYLPENPLPAKARSKRSRSSRAAPCDWSTRLLHLPSEPKQPPPPSKMAPPKRKDCPNSLNSDSSGRKCVHCGAEKTPQWRTGPLGPKTLCNACGVRYKSGRLVPEYRPAASPTFVSTKHSNSHRKVLELRRQRELQRAHQQQQQFLSQTSIFGASNGGDDFLIHRHGGPNYQPMI